MDAWNGLLMGLGAAMAPTNLLACGAGCLIGTLVGVLPGLGPVAAMSLLLPMTFSMDVTAALVMLSGIYYGSMYGGSTTSILVNVPGEAASVVTCIDGYQMARQGRAGPALSISAIGSFVAGTFGVLVLTAIAKPLARFALRFGPPEFAALAFLGFVVLSRLSGGSLLKAYSMVILGFMLSTVGMDQTSGTSRFTFGFQPLIQGLEFVPVIMGLYGLAEVIKGVMEKDNPVTVLTFDSRTLLPTRHDLKRSAGPIGRGSVMGFLFGLIPGPANIISTFASYSMERTLSKRKEEFGKGAIEGVAGPESANNAATAGALVPLLLLGVPFSPLPALLLAAFMIHGVLPGPLLMTQKPLVFWAIVASMYIGNVILLILNLPLVSLFARVAKLPSRFLLPVVAAFCFLGTFSVRNALFDLWVVAIFGILGHILQRAKFDPAPLALGMIIGPMFEDSLRQSLILFEGDLLGFMSRPFALGMIVVAVLVLAVSGGSRIRTCFKMKPQTGGRT